MDRIVSYEQILGFVGEIKNLRRGFVTNFFWDEAKHPYWIEGNTFCYTKVDDCYLFLHNNDGFYNLFYLATDMNVAIDAIRLMQADKDLVVDVVVKGDKKNEVEMLAQAGFVPYNSLFRMSHIGLLAEDNWNSHEDVIFANDTDANDIYNSLHSDFDPICEQLPSLQEVRDYIQKKMLLVTKDGNQLCGYLLFELMGKTSWYLRYWYTSPLYRNQGIGARLLKAALAVGKTTKRQQLWVLCDNDNAIKRYEHYGFSKEDIHDYVLIKRK